MQQDEVLHLFPEAMRDRWRKVAVWADRLQEIRLRAEAPITVLIDNKAVASCITLTCECEGKEIVTIEGLQDPVTGELDPIQEAFFEKNAFQCGYCTPGIIMATKGLLIENPNPSEEEIKEGLSGNYCRCISHYQVLEAVKWCISGGANS